MQDEDEPPTIDTSRPSVARVYDALVGGKDNYEVDRAVLREVLEVAPEAQITAKEHREWLSRVVRLLTERFGIDQFLDCGSGLPTAENTHEIAQRSNPEANVVYVDNDPVVEAHGRALLEDNDRTHFVAEDLTKVHELLTGPTVTKYLDLSRPLGLIHCATLHHIDDLDEAREVMSAYVDALPSGSYVAITHQHDASDGSQQSRIARDLQEKFRGAVGSSRHRTREEIRSLLDGLELVEPGLSFLHDWWPDGPRLTPVPDVNYTVLGALARKP